MRSTGVDKSASKKRFRTAVWVSLIAIHLALSGWFLAATDGGPNAARTGFPLDDAWIHLVYGSTLATDFAPLYNDEWEAGFTSPAWMLFLALAHWIAGPSGLPIVLVVKWMGACLGAMTSVLLYQTLRRMEVYPAIALFGAGLHAFSPWLVFAQVSGMEIALTSSCAILTLFLLFERRVFAAGIAGALCVLARPEMALVVLVLAVATAVASARQSDTLQGLRRAVAFASPSIAAALAWSSVCYFISGRLLPNTFYAKFSPRDMESFPRIVGEFLFSLPLSVWFVGLLLLLLGTMHCVNTSRPLYRACAVIPWLLIAAIAASRRFPQGYSEFFYWQRYMLPVLPFLFLLAALGLQQLAALFPKAKSARGLGGRGVWMAIAAFVFGMQISELPTLRSVYSWNCRNINEVQVAFGRWVNEHVDANRAVAVNDAGAIRYIGHRFTVDLLGLNDHDILFDRESAVGIRRDLRVLHRFLVERNVEYLIIFPSWFGQVVQDPSFPAYFAETASFSSKHYTISRGKQDTMIAYRVLDPLDMEPTDAAGR